MSKIKIGRIWFPVLSLGYGRRLGIWVQGCSHSCSGCISPSLRPFDCGEEYIVKDLLKYVAADCVTIDGITISGGEPFDQPEALEELVDGFLQMGLDDILVYSGYTREQLEGKESDVIRRILTKIAVLIDGPYVKEKNSGKGLKGSDNQKVWINRYIERYEQLDVCERKLQCVLMGQQLWLIGVPPV